MFRHYNDKRIYRNLKINLSTSIVAFCAILFILINFLIARYGLGYESKRIICVSKIDEENIPFLFVFLLSMPLAVALWICPMLKIHDSAFKENEFNNDFLKTLVLIFISFMPLVYFIFISVLNRTSNYIECLCLVSELHMPNYVACGLLIQNCVLIKREWKDDPPEFVKENQAEIKQQKEAKKSEQDKRQYLALIEKSGIRFFIKYYRQILYLPLKDVDITESYSSAEREERLLAAKKIIDLGLSELALSEIIRAYDDILDKDLIDQARKILSEIQKGKSVTSDKHNAIKA